MTGKVIVQKKLIVWKKKFQIRCMSQVSLDVFSFYLVFQLNIFLDRRDNIKLFNIYTNYGD